MDGGNKEYESGAGGLASLKACGFTMGRYAEKEIIAVWKDLLVNLIAGGGGRIANDTRYGAVEILAVKLR